MRNWWNWVLAFSLFCLLFLTITLMLSGEPSRAQLQMMFNDYVNKFNKTYSNPEEYESRFQHFVASVKEIETLNAASRGPDNSRAKYGLTKLSDMSKTEFQDIHLSDERLMKAPHQYGKTWNKMKPTFDYSKYDTEHEHGHHQRDRSFDHETHDNLYIIIRKNRAVLPLKVDWRTKGIISPVKNQGLCGACWAFSTVGTIEAMSAMKSEKLEPLSVQEIIDCAGLGNKGCAGGDICLLLDWLMLTDAVIEKEKEYPLSLSSGACKAKKNATGVKVESFTCDDENKILEALALHGPVAVAVNALTWQNYLGGIIQMHCSGSPMDLNHAVELVGYDLTGEVPYYIAKNSWGKDFGNGGYINLAIGSNICGLANEVATVTVK